MTLRMIEKAKRLLTDGRVVVVLNANGKVLARVRGDSGDYQVTTTEDRPLQCTCPSFRRRCSHVLAVELVTGRGS